MANRPPTFFPPDSCLSSVTDLYELTMAAAYFENRMEGLATFELWVRDLPLRRSYLIACGLEDCVKYLADLSFTGDTIKYLRGLENFRRIGAEFFRHLRRLKFTGDLWAAPEGTVIFAGEPILRVTAPIIEAQLVETFLLSVINYQTTVATKASRVVRAANYGGVERVVSDFGLRRAHGPAAGISAARAAFIGGCAGTSNVYAGRRYGIPVHGTAAHSWIMAFDTEIESFRKYTRLFSRHDIPAHRHVRPEERRAERGDNRAVAQGRAHRQRRPRGGRQNGPRHPGQRRAEDRADCGQRRFERAQDSQTARGRRAD